MSYILIVTIISSFGSADVQRVGGFASLSRTRDARAVAWAESQQPLHPDSHLRWQCERAR